MLQICWSPGLCPGPRWGSLQRSPRPPSWWGGGSPVGPQTSALRLRPYGPRPTVPHILNHGYAHGAPKLLLNRGPSEPCYATVWNIGWKWCHTVRFTAEIYIVRFVSDFDIRYISLQWYCKRVCCLITRGNIHNLCKLLTVFSDRRAPLAKNITMHNHEM